MTEDGVQNDYGQNQRVRRDTAGNSMPKFLCFDSKGYDARAPALSYKEREHDEGIASTLGTEYG